jgi:hypothetical protein
VNVRRTPWLVCLPLAAALTSTLALPATAAPASGRATQAAVGAAAAVGHRAAGSACIAATPQVKALASTVTSLGTALAAVPPSTTALGQASGDLMNAVIAVVSAGCLPALPSATPSTTPAAPNAAACLVAEVKLRQATLGVIAAAIATPPNLTAALQAATALVSALTTINSDSCLPVALPVPTVPALPGLPARTQSAE